MISLDITPLEILPTSSTNSSHGHTGISFSKYYNKSIDNSQIILYIQFGISNFV